VVFKKLFGSEFNQFAVLAIFMVLALHVTPVLAEDAILDSSISTVDTVNADDQAATTGEASVGSEVAQTLPAVDNPEATVVTEPEIATEQEISSTVPETSVEEEISEELPVDDLTDPLGICNDDAGTVDAVEGLPEEQPLDVDNNVVLNNTLCSTADSGDALVTEGDVAGNATSGDAQAQATLLNQIQSLYGLSDSEMATFTQNIYGSVFGDILIDPAMLEYVLANGCGNLCLPSSGTTYLNNNAVINNDIYLSATSGNAEVSNNQVGGDATSGNASAMLNLINIINSIISSGQSFFGTINIYGDLDGDILLPPDIISSLLTPSSTEISDRPRKSGTYNVNQTVNESINNNLYLNANSGNALVSNNGSAGNATSGSSSTNLNVYNLAGSQVIGKNALLVFVNVLGQWTGFIINSPVGATSASLGVNPTSSQCFDSCLGNLDASFNSNLQINNNIYLSAVSGNATVSGNDSAGNATTGNALTSLNLVNIINSNLALSDWFGVLFINVFGTWNGSFGIDTMAGNLPVVAVQGEVTQPKNVKSTTSSNTNVFHFVPNNWNVLTDVSDTDEEDTVVKSLKIAGSGLYDLDVTNDSDSFFNNNRLLFVALTVALLSILGTSKIREDIV
jgi:hypothetical protein